MTVQVGDWIHVEPCNLSVERFNPTQLNQYKNRVQQPFFRLMMRDDAGLDREIMVNGRTQLWALLDALFPYDKLPRKPVNQFMQENPNDFLHDLNSFFDESKTPYISIMLGEVDDPYSTVGKKWAEPGAVIITANAGLQAPDCVAIADRYNGLVVPGTWRDSKGSHDVPCVIIEGYIHIHDLGSQLVIGAVFTNEHGDNVRPLPPDTLKKGVAWPSVLASIIAKHDESIHQVVGRLYPPSNASIDPPLRSSELMAKEFERFMRGHTPE